jgi:hypothetical protein
MPAADELFRTTAGNGTLVREGREGHEARDVRGEEEAESTDDRPGRDRGLNPAGPPNGSVAPATAGLKGPAKTVPSAAAEQSSVKPVAEPAVPAPAAPPAAAPAAPPTVPNPAPARKVTAPRRPSGRERHDEKITVYVSPDELIGLEHARIMLRGEYGLAVDRGRIVREAVAALLADLDARGRDSILVKRLSAGG